MQTKFAIYALLLCVASTLAVGQQVSVNYNHNANFSHYHTYAWGGHGAEGPAEGRGERQP